MLGSALLQTKKTEHSSGLYSRGEHTRDRIAAALNRPVILTAIRIGQFGQVLVHTTNWSNYWRPVEILRRPTLTEHLSQLRRAWEDYVGSRFAADLVQPYCLAYFSLLEAVTAPQEQDSDSRLGRALSTILGFENFAIIGPKNDSATPAAATSTARNPAYLLARLKWPTVPHSTRFLPLISLTNTQGGENFGHYRRYSVSNSDDLSIMVYPKNTRGGDLDSLAAIGSLITAMGSSTDPFVNDRAGRLWEHVVRPLAQQFKGELRTVEITDIGSSTGSVVGRIAANLVTSTVDASHPRIRITLVDSAPNLLSPVFSEPLVQARLDDVQQVSSDYRAWLANAPYREPQHGQLRLAFACKVFDMASEFVIREFGESELATPPSDPVWFDAEHRSVTHAIASDGYESLLVSSQRFEVEEGHVFAQASMSDYFEALQRLSRNKRYSEGRLCLPVRVFDSSTLTTSLGGSAVEAALRGHDFLVIEDADLRPDDLLHHLRVMKLDAIAAIDLTSSMRLSGNYAYLLWKKDARTPELDGEYLT